MQCQIKFDRKNKTFYQNDIVKGVIYIKTPSNSSHNGIQLSIEGKVNLQLSARSVGLFEAFYSTLKPISLMSCTLKLSDGGKLKKGITEFIFEFPIKPNGKHLCETYHGVYVNIQYIAICEIKGSMLSRGLTTRQEFNVHIPEGIDGTTTLITNDKITTDGKKKKKKKKGDDDGKTGESNGIKEHVPVPYSFKITPNTLQNIKEGAQNHIPRFEFVGKLDDTVCDINKPFTGELIIKKSLVRIKSIELQLVRVETCYYMEGEAREATEIQNIQIGDGNVCRNIAIPIYMLFPNNFTCKTTISKTFKIEFELNLIVLFEDEHMVTENFMLKLWRSNETKK